MKTEESVRTDELLLIYQLISTAIESLMVYRSPAAAAEHLEAARRACLRVRAAV